jgi:hypothetical protein
VVGFLKNPPVDEHEHMSPPDRRPTDYRPADLARRMAKRREHSHVSQRDSVGVLDRWRRETFTLPKTEAREKAREWFSRFPKAAYMTEIEWWRELEDGQIEFTMRRLPSAD